MFGERELEDVEKVGGVVFGVDDGLERGVSEAGLSKLILECACDEVSSGVPIDDADEVNERVRVGECVEDVRGGEFGCESAGNASECESGNRVKSVHLSEEVDPSLFFRKENDVGK